MTAGAAVAARPARDWRRRLREQPTIPLLILLAALILLLQLVQPGIVSGTWIANTIKFATPLAILAASQTLVMLTGGIDLSVAQVATMGAYLAATRSQPGLVNDHAAMSFSWNEPARLKSPAI